MLLILDMLLMLLILDVIVLLKHYKGFVITMPFSTCEGLLCARHQAKQLTQVTALNIHSSPRKQVGYMILTF